MFKHNFVKKIEISASFINFFKINSPKIIIFFTIFYKYFQKSFFKSLKNFQTYMIPKFL